MSAEQEAAAGTAGRLSQLGSRWPDSGSEAGRMAEMRPMTAVARQAAAPRPRAYRGPAATIPAAIAF
jgi:hypothetical protein